jgi:DNA-binding IclR family transcriptional regulator
MSETEFNANEVVAGFPLLSIRHALQWVGVMPDRDDIKTVAEALKCSASQAERILETLEERGFVTKAPKKRQWDQTAEGYQLSRKWQPPRRLHPVIDRDDENNATNTGFESKTSPEPVVTS